MYHLPFCVGGGIDFMSEWCEYFTAKYVLTCIYILNYSDYKEYNTDTTVKFIITMTRDQFARHESDGFHKAFKLQTSISISSMVSVFTRI